MRAYNSIILGICVLLMSPGSRLAAQPISMEEPAPATSYSQVTSKGARLQPGGQPEEKKPEASLAIADLIKKQRKARSENNVEEEKQCLIELIRLDPNNPVYRARLDELGGMQPKAELPARMKVPAPPPSKPVPPADLTRYEWAVENVPSNVALSLVTHLQSLKTTDPTWNTSMVEVVPVDEAETEKKMMEGSTEKVAAGSKLQNLSIENLTLGQGQALMAFWNGVQSTMPDEVGALIPKLTPWKSEAEDKKSVGKLSQLIAKKKSKSGNRGSGDILYSFTAKDMEITDALALFARLNDLNIVPDPEVKGTVTVDFRGLNLDKALEAILEAKGFFAEEQGGLIRVKGMETRYYVLDYLRIQRQGQVQTQADVSNIVNNSGGSTGGGGGGASGGGGGGGSGGGSGGGASAEGTVTIQSQDTIDIWKDIEKQLKEQLSPTGKLSINSMAGTVIITDTRPKIREFDEYFKLLKGTIYRQVDLTMKILDVELNDYFKAGINWERVAAYVSQTAIVAAGNMTGVGVPSTILTALSPATLSVVKGANQVQAVLEAIAQQGKLNVISQPRIRTLNHMTALVKVVQENPFFVSQSNVLQSQSGNAQGNNVAINTVSTGTVLSITPQVSEDDRVQLDIQPVISTLRSTQSFVQTVTTSNNVAVTTTNATAPVIDVKQAASVVRVNDQDTIIMGGLIQEQDVKNKEWIPVLGDIPGIGYLFTGVAEGKVRKELVLFVTPTIVRE